MQSSPSPAHPQLPVLQTEMVSDSMTGSNPVSPASTDSPASSGAGGISPQHLAQDSSLDGPPGPTDVSSVPLVGLGLSHPADPASKGPKWEKSHAEIAEQAKHEAEIETRIAELRKEGFWSLRRLPKVPEPARPKGHWDYLCEEMQWLSADFAQERRWKRGVARKVVRMVIRHHEEQRQKEERAKREEQAKLRRIASSIAKEVKQFWSNVEKVVQFKQQSRLEEKRKKALDLQLDFIVGQTEKYSDLLSQSLNQPLAPTPSKAGSSPGLGSSHTGSAASSPPPPVLPQLDDEDGDFQPQEEEEDDEETIEVEEQQEGNDAETQRREIELLRREGELPLEELLRSLPPQLLVAPSSPTQVPSSSDGDSQEVLEEDGEEEEPSQGMKHPTTVTHRNKQLWHPDEEDEEFRADEDEAEDEEDTIAAEEQLAGEVDHATELSELAREGELSVEELLQQYAGAYASDASVPGSGSSEDDEDEDNATSSECEQDQEEERHPHEDSSSQSEAEEPIEEEEENVSEEEEASENSDSEESESEVSEQSEEAQPRNRADEEEEEEDDDFGVEYLLAQDEEGSEVKGDSGPAAPGPPPSLGPKKEITDIAAAAESLQPKGYTLATTQVKTPIPLLLRGQLREYQHIGLDWLVTMYEKKLNGILADEMGLGKTIQTISLLAHLACEKGNWGPHLIIVPTSVMLNWEMELKRWCPSFKILTYYGAQKERKLKRQGWTKPNAFHVCITSYKLVLQDHQAFRRKNWRYLILDEAQNIKNFKSQRWQSLLNFNSQRRLLLTGTPLQNSLMELWSLMHFLMPHVFQSHREFKEWFSNPLTGMIEGSQEYNEGLVKRLHKVLRPFLLRRVKVDVEKQMPKKYEHVIRCRLSKRQRCLYDDFMAQATTKETLATGHFMSVINILMQLRKVCNHPNLFDPRPVTSPFITPGICFSTASLVLQATDTHPLQRVDMGRFDLIGLEGRVSRYEADTFLPRHRLSRRVLLEVATAPDPPPRPKPVKMKVNRMLQPVPKPEGRTVVVVNSPRTPLSPAPARPPPGPEHSAQLTPGPTPPVLPAPLLVSSSSPGAPLSPTSRPPGPVLLPPLQPNSGPLPQVLPPPLGVLGGTPRPPTPALPLKPSPPAPVRLSPSAPPGSSSLLKPLTVPPGYAFPAAAPPTPGPQRLILSPDMQARLPSGEVVSIGQLASLAQRPVASTGGSKPLTFQIQGNKLTLTGAQVRQLAVGQPRPLQRNVVHLVSAGGQHQIISQPAHVALIQAVAPTPGPTPVSVLPSSTPSTTPAPTGLSLPLAANQVPPAMVNSSGVVKIVVRQAPRDGLGPSPQLAPPPRPSSSGLPALLTPRPALPSGRLPTPTLGPARGPLPTLVRPLLRLLHSPPPETTASVPGSAPVPISSSPLSVSTSLPGSSSSPLSSPILSPLPIPVSSSLTGPGSSPIPISGSTSLPISISTPLPNPNSSPLPVLAPLPVSVSTPSLLPPVASAVSTSASAQSPLGVASSAPALTLGLSTTPSPAAAQAPVHPLTLTSASTNVQSPNLTGASAPAPVLVPASALASPVPTISAPSSTQAPILTPSSTAPQALTSSLTPGPVPPTAILASSPLPSPVPIPVLAPSPGPTPVLVPSPTPVPVLAPSSVPVSTFASTSSLVPAPTPVLAPSSTQTLVPAIVPTPSIGPPSTQTLTLAPALAPPLSGPTPVQTLSLAPTTPLGPSPAQTLSLAPATPLGPSPAQTLALAPTSPLGPTQTLSLAPIPSLGPAQALSMAPTPALGPSPAQTLSLAPASPLGSPPTHALTLAPAQTLNLTPAPVQVPSLGPTPAQTLTLAPAQTISSAPLPSSLLAPASGPAPSQVTMVSRLPAPKDEPETLTLRSGPPSPPLPATSFCGVRPRRQPPPPPRSPFYLDTLEEKRKRQRAERLERLFQLSEAHGALAPVYGTEVLQFCSLHQPLASPVGPPVPGPSHPAFWTFTEAAHQAVLFPQQRLDQLAEIIERFIFVMPPVEAPAPSLHACHPPPWLAPRHAAFKEHLACELWPRARPLHRIVCNMRTQFPDLRLIQYDCGKLQTLAVLLRRLKAGAHRVLIFTQMTRMLDVLEQFLTYHGHLYLRLDGSTRVEQRQALMERFNADKRIFCFILSTRSGGVGVNLTGADTVIFYDSDWNPTMDAQAQDRCHRIGQTRDVHIYRLISERTVEENILKKANQKRMLGDMAIEGGNFTTAYFKQQTIRELFDMPLEEPAVPVPPVPSAPEEEEEAVANKQTHILEQALCRAEDEEDIRAATQAKAEQVAELAEFNENEGFPTGEGEESGRPGAEDEEVSRAEQEIAALVEQLTPIERYAMNFLEASLEDVSREELKQAEEQVEAARKDLDQAKEEVFRLPREEEVGTGAGDEMACGTGGGSHRRSKKAKAPERPGTRVSERLRGARPETPVANSAATPPAHHTRSNSTAPRHSRSPANERAPRATSRPRIISVPAPVSTSSPATPPVPLSTLPVSTSPPIPNLPLTLRPEIESSTQLEPLPQSLEPKYEEAVVAGPKTPPLTPPPTKDLPSSTTELPIPEESLFPSVLAPSPTPKAEVVSNGHELESPECVEETTPIPPSDEELTLALSEDNDLGSPFPRVPEELFQELPDIQQPVEVRIPLPSPEKLQGPAPSEVTGPSASSSAASSPESPSPARPPRRRTSADVEIRGQGTGRTGQPPGPKVLRKLPGRLVTVVEEKELVRRRRQQRPASTPPATGASEIGVSPGSSSTRSNSEPESSPPLGGSCDSLSLSTLPPQARRPLPARRRIDLSSSGGDSPENGEQGQLVTGLPVLKRKRGRPPKNRSPGDAGRELHELLQPVPKDKANGAELVASPVEKRRRGRPPKAKEPPTPGALPTQGGGGTESRTPPPPLPSPPPPSLPLPLPLSPPPPPSPPPVPACPTAVSPSPPKRKRGRPPKNPPSPRPSQPPAFEHDSSLGLEAGGGGKQQQKPSVESEGSSSDEDGGRPLTRLARLRLEAEGPRVRKAEGSVAAIPNRDDTESAESGTGGTDSTTPPVPLLPVPRSTRLRPGSLVPPLESEKVPRKRSGMPAIGGPVPAKRRYPRPRSPLGAEMSTEESEAEASGEEEAESDGVPRRRPLSRRPVVATSGDQRVLRSSAPMNTVGPSLSHRGRKAKT
ncbi:helicase SRCAP [Gracilinanus agilis]|uniref:helicase SRCAP n=1 Tax=Gracilinanus agilis TaxID=191870 RepID=UPI001CFC7011|nr:helicase SRCAP [Gracilinanus agilis]